MATIIGVETENCPDCSDSGHRALSDIPGDLDWCTCPAGLAAADAWHEAGRRDRDLRDEAKLEERNGD